MAIFENAHSEVMYDLDTISKFLLMDENTRFNKFGVKLKNAIPIIQDYHRTAIQKAAELETEKLINQELRKLIISLKEKENKNE